MKKLIRLVKKIFRSSGKKGVSLQFKNAGSEDICSLRVIIDKNIHEFRNLLTETCTLPVMLDESHLYFFAYVVTASDRIYYEPTSSQLMKTIKKGEIIVSLFIEKKEDGPATVLMYPETGKRL